jgi:hypothetical protein
MVPSQELANAFKEMSRSDGMQKGIYSARTEFQELISELGRNNDTETQKHVLKSLKAINNAIEGRPISAKTPLNKAVEQVFDNIGKFCKKNQQQMMGVSKLMQLQIDIDKTLKSASEGTTPSQEQMDKIKAQYAEMTKIDGIGRKDKKSIEWVKTGADTKAFKGNLQSYIKERSEQLGLGRDLGRKVAHQQFKLPKKQNFFRKLFNRLFRREQEVMATVVQTVGQQLQEPVLETAGSAQGKIQEVLKTPQFKEATKKAHSPNINASTNRKPQQHQAEKNSRSLG